MASGESTSDLESILEAAKAKMAEMNLSTDGERLAPDGTSLPFSGDGFGGELTINSDLAISLNAGTECLDNPDQ